MDRVSFVSKMSYKSLASSAIVKNAQRTAGFAWLIEPYRNIFCINRIACKLGLFGSELQSNAPDGSKACRCNWLGGRRYIDISYPKRWQQRTMLQFELTETEYTTALEKMATYLASPYLVEPWQSRVRRCSSHLTNSLYQMSKKIRVLLTRQKDLSSNARSTDRFNWILRVRWSTNL
jgi:hypothetical protein